MKPFFFLVYEEMLEDFMEVNDLQPCQRESEPTAPAPELRENFSDQDSDNQDRHGQ